MENISDYDFHDGAIIDLIHVADGIQILMESAEIASEDLKDDLSLSETYTLRGKLHLEKISEIKINGLNYTEIKKTYDEAGIYAFDIKNNVVKFGISWINHLPKRYENTDYITIEIEAENIYWENIPALHNPYR